MTLNYSGQFGDSGKYNYVSWSAQFTSATDPQLGCSTLQTTPTTTVPLQAGAPVVFQWSHEGQAQAIDPSHKGPCTFYIAKAGTTGLPTWFKFYEVTQQQTATGAKWCTEQIAESSTVSTKLPNIPAGQYLLRTELQALHDTNHPQFYVSCVDIKVTAASGNAATFPTTGGVQIPSTQYLTTKSSSYTYSVYNNPISSYVPIGPPIAFGMC